jgi:hypothetical protein
VVLILWSLAGVSLAWEFLPAFLHFIGLNRHRIRADEPPADPRLGDTDAFSKDVHRQLHLLGFHFIGSMTETHLFVGVQWVHSTQFRVFAQPAEQCYACLYRPAKERAVRVALATVFTPMGLIWTDNSAMGGKVERNDFVRQEVPSNDLSPVLIHHREVVGQFVAEGRAPTPVDTLEPLLASARHYIPEDHRQAELQLRPWLRSRVIWLGLPVFFVALLDLSPALLVPCVILADGLIFAYQTKQSYKAWAVRRVAEVRRLGLELPNESSDDGLALGSREGVSAGEDTRIMKKPPHDPDWSIRAK